MKRIIPLIAVAIAMAVPATMTAQTYNYYNYNVETPLLEIVEAAILDGDFTFDTETHETQFLTGIRTLYDYRDADNWSACVTTADDLAAKAAEWIVEDNVASNVAFVCTAVGDIYGESPTNFADVKIATENEEQVILSMEPLWGFRIGDVFIGICHEKVYPYCRLSLCIVFYF